MVFEVVGSLRLSFGDLLWPLLQVACMAAAEAVHEDGGAGALFAAEDAVLLRPFEQ